MSAVTVATKQISAWRHPDPRVADLPGVAVDGFDDVPSSPDAAGDLYRRGVRRVALHEVVDLSGAASGAGSPSGPATALEQLAFVRDLTGHGVVVDWQVRLGDTPGAWSALTHLYPPTGLLGTPEAAEALDHWRAYFHLCRCVYRVGPGFIQVRDRRSGELNRLTIDEPDYLEAVGHLLPGVPETAIPPGVLADLAAEHLVWSTAGRVVWLPYRVRRWPWPSMAT